MKIEFPLLSILSVCVLLFFGLQGDVELYSWEIGVSLLPNEVRITVDPVFAVWVSQAVVYSIGCNAFTCGNVMVLDEQQRDNLYGDYLLAHESNHVEQFHALRWLTWIAQPFINIEPPKSLATEWDDPRQCDRTMWEPPSFKISQWHFLAICVNS